MREHLMILGAVALCVALLAGCGSGGSQDSSEAAALPPLPVVTCATLWTQGADYEGATVLVQGLQTFEDDWPDSPTSAAVSVSASDDGGVTLLTLYFPEGTLTGAMIARLAEIGDGPFDAVGKVVERWANVFELEVSDVDDITLPISRFRGEDASGVATYLGRTVTTQGVVTVSAGTLANKKLKVFIQGSPYGVMVFHENGSAEITPGDFETGDRVRVTGVISQDDLVGDNPARGTVRVDISNGSWEVLSRGNTLPPPQVVTLADVAADGDVYEGELVRARDVYKVSGDWPAAAGVKTMSVTVSDGTEELSLRFERNTISQALVNKLAGIGNGEFQLTGIVVQNDLNDDGDLLDEYQIWPRGADDIASPAEPVEPEPEEPEEPGEPTESIELARQAALGETVTAEGVVTIASGVLFAAKFEVFIQDDTGAVMLLHNDMVALGVSVSPGDLVRATGVLAQTDTSGQPLTGTLRLDLNSGGAVQVMSTGNPLPSAQVVTVAQYLADPEAYEGELIRINGVSISSGSWPAVGVKSDGLFITDGTADPIELQIQKGANTADLTGTADPFDVVGIAIQNGASWEIWIRSPDDINP